MLKSEHPTSMQHWYTQLRQLPQTPGIDLSHALQETGSLTRLLDLRCNGISISPLSQYWGMATRDEQAALGLVSRSRCYIREVHLKCRERIWVQARTVIPVATLKGKRRRLLYLGRRSLGEFLFNYPGMYRSPLEYSQLHHRHPLIEKYLQLAPNSIYARRGVYYLDDLPLLVMEIFLPDLFQQM